MEGEFGAEQPPLVDRLEIEMIRIDRRPSKSDKLVDHGECCGENLWWCLSAALFNMRRTRNIDIVVVEHMGTECNTTRQFETTL